MFFFINAHKNFIYCYTLTFESYNDAYRGSEKLLNCYEILVIENL